MILEKIGMSGQGGGEGYVWPSYGSGGQPNTGCGQFKQGGYQPVTS